MLSTRMIIDHRMLSMNSSRGAGRASVAAPVVAPIVMSAISRHPVMIGNSGPRPLEPRQFRKCQFAAVHMDAAEFGAAVQGRKHFSRIEQALGVEGAFQPLLLAEIDVAEHLAH